MEPEDEIRLRRNWSLLKEELSIEEFVHRFVALGVFSLTQQDEILNVQPNTDNMKGEKFLQAVVQSESKGYQTLCNIILENKDQRYTQLIEQLDIQPPSARSSSGLESRPQSSTRPSTGMSTSSSVRSGDSETGERKDRSVHSARRQWRTNTLTTPEQAPTDNSERENYKPDGAADSNSNIAREASNVSFTREKSNIEEIVSETVARATRQLERSNSGFANADMTDNADKNATVDMQALENELVRIAPTIADLFQKISKQNNTTPASEEECNRLKDENERLRKTNKALIEKLNSFQQRIIQLQLENKKLKDNGDEEKVRQEDMKKRSIELEELENKLQEQKKELEEKEYELNLQLMKLKAIEQENEEQKEKLNRLQELHEESVQESISQQEQISQLVEEKEKQKEQIEHLEEKQKFGEHRLFRLEERLMMLEQVQPQQRRSRRSMPPPRAHWMSGIVDRSHHASVKFQPELSRSYQEDYSSPQSKKGWSF